MTCAYKPAVAVRVMRPYVVHVTFADGLVREIDLADHLPGPMFEPLKAPAAFAKVRIDPAFGVLEWPNGADLAPEFTYRAGRVVTPADS